MGTTANSEGGKVSSVWRAYKERLTLNVGVRLSPTQTRSLREADGTVNLWHGSVRSGKTIASIIRWLLYVETAPKHGELVMTGRTRDTVWRNVILPMMDTDIVGQRFADAVVGNFGAPFVKIFGRRVHVLGASDVTAELAIRGMTVAGAYCDEVTTYNEHFWAQLLARMSVRGARLFGTTNPDSPQHWLRTKYLQRVQKPTTAEDEHLAETWRLWHFTLDDNTGLPHEYKAQLRAQFPAGLFHRRYILGEWVQAEGAIYDMWDEDRHVIAPTSLPVMDRVLALGIDYGTTNQTAGILLGMAGGVLYALDEWAPKITAGRSLTDAEQSRALRAWLPSRPVESWRRPEWIYLDPSAASLRTQMVDDGVQALAPAWNQVVPGIRQVGSLLAMDRLKISALCTNLRREIPGYVWDAKSKTDAPLKRDDHFSDALRYAVHSSSPTWRQHLPTTYDQQEP